MKALPLRSFLQRGLLSATALVLILTTLILSIRIGLEFHSSANDSLNSLGRIFARNLEAPLAFIDHEEISRTVQVLKIEPRIQDAVVFDATGKPLISLKNPDFSMYVTETEFLNFYKSKFLPELSRCFDIAGTGSKSGSVCLSYDSSLLLRELLNLLALISIIMGAGLGMAFSLSRVIQKPLTESLAGLMTVISRVRRSGGYADVETKELQTVGAIEEMELLKSEFRNMIELIQEKEHEIMQMNTNLEKLVEARTSELNEERAIAVERSKLASLGEMAGGVAHEINNPLAIIQGLSEQLNRRMENGQATPEKIKETLLRIAKTSDRIAKIVKGLRSFARDGGSDPITPTPMNTIIEETMGFCEARMKNHGIELRLKNTQCSAEIPCRSVQISQMLLNLLNNSVDAIEGTPSAWIELEVIDNPGTIEVHVTDSGKGIPKDIAAKIFQPFFTTKPVGKGTGLGLAIIAGIAKSHNGEIWIDENSPNTKFCIRLPKVTAAQAA